MVERRKYNVIHIESDIPINGMFAKIDYLNLRYQLGIINTFFKSLDNNKHV